MSDPKLTAQMLDLSRNIEKLTGAVKTNTETSEKIEKSNAEENKGLKETFSKLGGELKNLDFKEISKEFGGITKSIKELDFKKIGEDFKGVTKSFGEIGKSLGDIKSLKDIPKNFGEISKSFGGIKNLTKDFKGITKELKGADKIKGLVSGDIGKKILGAFESGGPVEETGNYLVGEKGPEIVKLESGNKVIPNDKIISADQKLSEKVGPTEKQIEKYRNSLLKEDAGFYTEYPEELDADVKYWVKNNRYNKPEAIDSLLEGKGEETFTKEDVAKLTATVSPTPPPSALPTADEELSKSEKRKKEKIAKEERKEKSREEKNGERLEVKKETKESAGLISKIGKGLGENSGNIIDKGIKIGEGYIDKNIEDPFLKETLSSVLNKSGSFISKTLEKPKSVSNVTPLKSPAAKPVESPEKKPEQAENKKPEITKAESANVTEATTAENKTDGKKETSSEKTSGKSETNMSKADIDDMKSALFRIASLLEGTLIVSPIDSPYRPNSKRI